MTREDAPPADALAGAVYAPAWRIVIAVLRVWSRAGLLLVTALVAFGSELDMTPLVLFRAVAVAAALPALGAWLLERAFAARLRRDGTRLVAHARGRRVEIPLDAVGEVVPWRVPLPRPGVTLRLRAGRPIAVALDDPGALLGLLGADPYVPIVRWAAARARVGRGRWDGPLVRFPLFALVPAAVLFRTHQWIAYGGTFGQYYQLGLRAYLGTFLIYWATVTIYLVMWSNLWRLVAEAVTLVGAWAAPADVTSLRHRVERAWAVSYYGGALLVLLVRLMP